MSAEVQKQFEALGILESKAVAPTKLYVLSFLPKRRDTVSISAQTHQEAEFALSGKWLGCASLIRIPACEAEGAVWCQSDAPAGRAAALRR